MENQAHTRSAGATSGRRHSVLLLAAAAALLLAAGLMYPLDASIAEGVRDFSHRAGANHPIQQLLAFIRPLGKGDVLLLLALAGGVFGGRRRAAQIVVALLLVSILVWPFKFGVGRERPSGTNLLSFPSGDTAAIAAFCAPWLSASPWMLPATAGAVSAVALGRVYDGRHYPSDVLAGAAFGLIAGALALWLLRRRRPWNPARRWLLWAGGVLMVVQGLSIYWSRGDPDLLAFFKTWGPPLVILAAARLIPALIRKYADTLGTLLDVGPNRRRVILIVVGAILVLYFFLTTRSSLWDRDEPRFARATVEMVQSGNYLYPTFNGNLRPDKPILLYWLMSVPVRLLGPIELACRAVAPLSMAVACLLTYWLGKRFFSPRAGLLAMLILALSPLAMISGTVATTDALLLAGILAALAAFVRSLMDGFRPIHGLYLALALGAALLTKGPVGLAIPLLVILTTLVAARRCTSLTRIYLVWIAAAAGAGVALFLAWALPANHATGGEFLRLGIGRHVIQRSVHPLESHGGQSFLYAGYYLPVIALAFFPWVLYLPAAIHAVAARHVGRAGAREFLLGWIVPVLVMMSVVATKLPHYILPVWPALALLIAGTVCGWVEQRPLPGEHLSGRQHKYGDVFLARPRRRPRTRWLSLGADSRTKDDYENTSPYLRHRALNLRGGPWLFVPVGLVLGVAVISLAWVQPAASLRVPLVTLGATLLCLTAAARYLSKSGRHVETLALFAVGMVVLAATIGAIVLPAAERLKIAPQLARIINAKTSPDVPVATYGFGEPSLNFYLGRDHIETLNNPAELVAWAKRPGEGILVSREDKLLDELKEEAEAWVSLPHPDGNQLALPDAIWNHQEPKQDDSPWRRVAPLAVVRGFNYSQGKWVDVVVGFKK